MRVATSLPSADDLRMRVRTALQARWPGSQLLDQRLSALDRVAGYLAAVVEARSQSR